MAAVTFSSVGKVYADGTRAVQELTLTVADGELMVLVGPSGCGKTTALRMVAGLEDVTEGEIRIGGRVVNDLEPRRRDVAMVFQNYALYPHMRVYENIAFGLRMQGMTRSDADRRVREISRVLGIDDLLERKPRQLSGGQRQRVAMGRAIVRNPSVFLLDEPLSNLDARLRVQMRAEVSRIQHDLGVTTIYVTHDQVEAMTLGDRVAVMRKGKLQQTDDPQRLYDAPANLFVASFIGSPAMNLLEAALERRDGVLMARLGSQELALPDPPPQLAAYEGERIAIGLRPEHTGSGDGRLQGAVVLSEALGAHRLVHLELDAAPVATDDVREAQDPGGLPAPRRAELRALVEPDRAPRIGETFEVAIPSAKLQFFDLATGRAVS